jgi:hypothetical protein
MILAVFFLGERALHCHTVIFLGQGYLNGRLLTFALCPLIFFYGSTALDTRL